MPIKTLQRTIHELRSARFLVALIYGLAFTHAAAAGEAVDFRRDIRPILSDKCFQCHGPAEADRQGGFRLDQKESAFGEAESGEHPIVPGSLGDSALVVRITSDDEFERMPPPEANKTLSPDEVELLKRWIDEGAAWDEHWAFVRPKSAQIPKPADPEWVTNEIDHFIAHRLVAEGLTHSPIADKSKLLRRLSLDLVGLPPDLTRLEAFMADDSRDAYEKQVDQLLASPHFGEHQARFWLDAVRYADTHGLHLDNYREMWPYRDWVVKALNNNLPFDQFATEQLAGDLLDDPTMDQLIASGFNRCHVTTNEGGSIEEEVHIRNVVDRVVTTATVFMGLTFDCTRCHDHKYDPLTARDFYSLSAFFNSMDGPDMDMNAKAPAPVISVLTPENQQKLNDIDDRIAEIEQEIRQGLTKVNYKEPAAAPVALQATEWIWLEDEPPENMKLEGAWNHVHRPEPVFSGEKARVQAAPGLVQHYFKSDESDGDQNQWTIADGDVFFAYVLLDATDATQQIMLQFHSGSWEHRAFWGANLIEWGTDESPSRLRMGDLPKRGVWVRLEVAANQVGLMPGDVINGWAFTQFGGKAYWDRAGVLTRANPDYYDRSLARWTAALRLNKASRLPVTVRDAIQAEQPSDQQRKTLEEYYVTHVWRDARALFGPSIEELAAQKKSRAEIIDPAPTTLIYRESQTARPAFVLKRGEYDKRQEQVERNTPAILPPFPVRLTAKSIGACSLAIRSSPPAHSPCDGQPHLATILWHGSRGNGGRLWFTGGTTVTPGTTRLAGSTIHRGWLGSQAHHQTHCHVIHLSTTFRCQRESIGSRPGESPRRAWTALSFGCRIAARPGIICQWFAESSIGGSRRETTTTCRIMEGGRLCRLEHGYICC